MQKALKIAPGREKALLRHHPWVFSGALAQEPKDAPPGSIVEIVDGRGKFLGRGYYNLNSQIRARVLSFDPTEAIDEAFWRRRIEAAVRRRQRILHPERQTAARLVMSEADQLPGLIVDQYGDALVVQALTAGIDAHLEPIIFALIQATGARLVVERSDDAVRELEGLPNVSRVLHGTPPTAPIAILENGVKFGVDLTSGHKTGFYLDQRVNHERFRGLAAGASVLDCFAYTGGFGVCALAGGAKSVTFVDQSEGALEQAKDNVLRNGLDLGRCTFVHGNAFEILRKLRDERQSFDLVAMDPPKFAANGAQVDKAARGYKDVNLLAFKLLANEGALATFSCSGHVPPELFQKIIFGAAQDAHVPAQIQDRYFQADDHPVLLTVPETLYLKGFLLRAMPRREPAP